MHFNFDMIYDNNSMERLKSYNYVKFHIMSKDMIINTINGENFVNIKLEHFVLLSFYLIKYSTLKVVYHIS